MVKPLRIKYTVFVVGAALCRDKNWNRGVDPAVLEAVTARLELSLDDLDAIIERSAPEVVEQVRGGGRRP